MSLLIKLLGEERLSNIYRTYAAKQVKKGLKAEFQDDKGRWYYSFRDEQDLPHTRSAKSQTYSQYLASGLSGEMFDEAYEKINELFAHGDYLGAGVIINDLKVLKLNIVNVDIIVNIIAVNYIREDEELAVISDSIHQEKCDFLKSETEQGRFFFRVPEWLNLLKKAGILSEESEQFYQDFLLKKSNIVKRWSILASQKYKQDLPKK